MNPDLTLPGEIKVVVAGDWHANPNWVGRAIPEIAQDSRDIRTILHLGDFGIWSGIRGRKFLGTARARNSTGSRSTCSHRIAQSLSCEAAHQTDRFAIRSCLYRPQRTPSQSLLLPIMPPHPR